MALKLSVVDVVVVEKLSMQFISLLINFVLLYHLSYIFIHHIFEVFFAVYGVKACFPFFSSACKRLWVSMAKSKDKSKKKSIKSTQKTKKLHIHNRNEARFGINISHCYSKSKKAKSQKKSNENTNHNKRISTICNTFKSFVYGIHFVCLFLFILFNYLFVFSLVCVCVSFVTLFTVILVLFVFFFYLLCVLYMLCNINV